MAVLISVTEGDVTQIVLADVGVQGATGPSSPASGTPFTPYGNIAATNVQTAIQELDDEKFSKAGGTVTGSVVTTGVNSAAAGSAAAPSIAFTGDLDTGIYSPGANQVAISTNGVERVEFGASEVVFNDGGTNYDFRIEGDTVDNLFFINAANDRIGIGTIANLNGNKFQISAGSEASSAPYAAIFNTAASPTSAASTRLDLGFLSGTSNYVATNTVLGYINFIGQANDAGYGGAGISAIVTSGGNVGRAAGHSIDLTFSTKKSSVASSEEGMRLDSSGRLGLGTSAPQTLLHLNSAAATNTTLAYSENGALKWYNRYNASDGSFQIVDVAATLTRLHISNTGNVGIGTTSPGTALEVNGTIRSGTGSGASLTTGSIDVSKDIGLADGQGIVLGSARRIAISSTGTTTLNAASATAPFIANIGASEVARIDSSGRLGLGTSSPAFLLDVNGQARFGANPSALHFGVGNAFVAGQGELYSISTAPIGIGTAGSASINLYTNSAERARIDSSGRLLVGTSSARSNFFGTTLSAVTQTEGTGGAAGRGSLSVINNDVSNNPPYVLLGRSGAATLGSNAAVVSGSRLGTLTFQGADGTNFVEAATVAGEVDGTPGANDMPGRLVFSTTADGAASPTERMRINNAGKVLIGQTSTYAACDGWVNVTYNSASTAAPTLGLVNASATAAWVSFSDSAVVYGSITRSGSSTVYATSSDYRLKENVASVTDGITRLQQLKPSRFNFIANPDQTVDGFIAHEAQAVVPECVTGEKDAVDGDGNPVYQGIDQSKLVPLLTAALQEAIAKIETLEARLTAAGIE
jgi:hypothetical protein